MKKNLLFLMLMFLGMLPIFAQEVAKKHSLAERARASDFVIEGKVVSKSCFWDSKKRLIWTKNTIKLSKVFKGNVLGDVFEIITPGGTVGEEVITLSHNTVFSEGTEGIFFCVLRDLNEEKIVIPYYEHIYFHDDGVNAAATDEYGTYQDIKREIYPAIEKETHYRKNIAANMFEAKYLALSGGVFVPDDINTSFAIEYSFDNVAYTGANGQILAFDVYARSELSGISLADLTLFIDYSAISLGTNLVANQKITASKGTMILNNAYTLTVADSASDKLRIMIDAANGNPAALYQLSTQSEFLCHLEIDISAVILPGGAIFDEPSMQGRSEYYNGNNNSFVKYSSVKANDSLYSVTNTSSTAVGITYTLENPVYDNAQQKYTFDIYGFASAPNTYINTLSATVRYNPAAFGTNVVMSNHIQASSPIPAFYPNSYLVFDDEATSDWRFFIQLRDTVSPGTFELPTTSTHLFTVTLDVQDCTKPVGQFFDVSLMTGYNNHYTNVFPIQIEDYFPITATSFNDIVPCPDSLPNPYIATFYPQVITGGTQSILTITGGNFGNTRGKVWFIDVQNSNYIATPDSAYNNLIWSDNLIQVYVPSTNANAQVAGTGAIIVQKAAPSLLTDTSLVQLKIDYALVNDYKPNQNYRRVDLQNQNGAGGYTFKIHDILYTPTVKPAVDLAFAEWVCKTHVNFTINGTISNPTSIVDNINTVYLAPYADPLFSGANYYAITLTISRKQTCNTAIDPLATYTTEIDIAMRDGWLWHFDTTSIILANEQDFVSCLVHELGHAHSIDHCWDTTKIMHPILGLGRLHRHLHPSDSLAGLDVIVHNNWLNAIGCVPAMSPLACIVNAIELNTTPTQQIKVYPNPVENTLNISFHHLREENVLLTLFNAHGQEIFAKNLGRVSEGNHLEQLNLDELNIPQGMYLLNIQSNNSSTSQKLIIQ